MTSLTDVWVTVKPDMDKFGPEVKKKLARIDSAKEGKQVATRFGVGMNGALGSIVSRSAGIFAAGFAAVKVGGFLKGAISQASDLSESASKVNVVFKNASKSIFATGKTAATSMGLSESAYLAATGTLGNLLVSLDLAPAKAAAMSQEMVKLAGDLASFNNVSPDEALEALKSGLTGEAEPLKRFGVNMNDATLTAQALKMGLIKNTKEALTPQNKALAAQALIMAQTKTAQGDFARTSGGLANQQRILSARFADFKTTIGAVALPLATKFFGFLNKTAIPALSTVALGVKGAASAFSGEGVTSDGFVGFMERVGVVARSVFDIFKTQVIPRLKDFGGFIHDDVIPKLQEFAGFFVDKIVPKLQEFAGFLVGNIVPAVKNLISAFTPLAKDVGGAVVSVFQKLAPVVVAIGTAIVANVIPAFKSFTGFLKDNKALVGAVAVGIGAMVVAFYAYKFALGVVSAASKVFAAVQAAVNLVMSLNPISIVALALVGLAAGLIYAYKHSTRFREIVDKAFKVVKAAAVLMWDFYLKPMFVAFALGLKGLWETAQAFARFVGAAWGAIKEPARVAIRYVVDTFLGMVETVLTGASKAFGWVPGLGDKLKGAAKAFATFRDDVNKKLSGISDQTIKISPVVLAAQAAHRNSVQDRLGLFAKGGDVPASMGVRGKDSVHALLMPDEHVLTTKDVAAMGGQRAVYAFRAGLHKFAAGGAVGVNVNAALPNLNRSMANIVSVAKAVAQPIAQALGNQLARFSPDLAGVLSFVKSQVGKPYVWGGVGPGGYDCSGLVSAAINTALGRNPHHRLGATGSMPWSMFAPGPGAFEVGWFKGNPGHTAATVNGVNIESAGGVGVRMGAHARGARNSLFTDRAHVKGFKDGGAVDGDLPYDLPRNRKDLLAALGLGKPKVFDNGGPWKSGTLGVNTSGKTETVVPGNGQVELGSETLRSMEKAFANALKQGSFKLTQSGGSYVLQMSNG